MIDLIDREYIAKGKPADLATLVQYFTLDSLTDIGKLDLSLTEQTIERSGQLSDTPLDS